MKKTIVSLAAIAVMGVGSAFATGNHEGMSGMQHKEGMAHNHDGMQMDKSSQETGAMKGAFMVRKGIDGYTVSFHVMQPPEGMQKGGSHHFMVKVEKDGKVLTDIVVNSKAAHPNGESESKMMMKMGDWYMAGYDLGHKGQHQLMVLFKTADGAKPFGGVYYPDNNAK
jgi:hypothetical protein